MPNAENGKLQVETGATLHDYTLMTDLDHQYFAVTEDVWSGRSGYAPIVRPNGLVTGGAVTVGVSGSNDKIDVAGLTCYLAGVLVTVAAGADKTVLRGADADVCRINSVQITSAGAISIVSGTDHTAFSEVRDAPGGPPCILVGSIEIAQVRLGAVAAAPVTAAEIYNVVGQHTERYDFPTWEENNIGKGLAKTIAGEENAHIKFQDALPLSHTGGVCKRVYIKYYEPLYADVARALDFKPVENSHSVTSTQYYGGTSGARSSSIGQGGFTALLSSGVTDDIIKLKDQVLTFKFFPDRLKTMYVLTQGALGITRTFPVAAQIQAVCTISAEAVSADFEA
jgi:hypothetical protein